MTVTVETPNSLVRIIKYMAVLIVESVVDNEIVIVTGILYP